MSTSRLKKPHTFAAAAVCPAAFEGVAGTDLQPHMHTHRLAYPRIQALPVAGRR